jgi:crotonobetainyl-CoA:carnitine CoA-transferase CaiB-like acyl-CoA transferase
LLQIGELTTYAGSPAPPMGARDCLGASALERYYECADGWIAIACATAPRCAALMDALGLPDVDAQAALAEGHNGVLASRIAEVVKPLSVERALMRLRDAGAPAAPVLTVDDTYADAFLQENGYYESYLHPAFGSAKGVACAARFARTKTAFRRAAPMPGEHSVEVLRDFGLPRARIDALFDSGGVA